jgi:citrate lyase subunit beta / citryl-CoA lyase
MTLAVRSLMFVPGGRVAELLPKLARCRPDVAVADLEDAVAPADKDAARDAVVAALAAERPAAGAVLIRINGPGTPWHEADLAAVATAPVDGVVLPKYEHAEQLRSVRAALPAGAAIVVGLESALGIADARPLLAERPDAAYVGTEDLIADLGGRRTTAGTEVLYARSHVVLAARLAGVPAIDQVVAAVRDTEAFRVDAEQARDLGYHGKICLHPLQVPIAHAVFTPSEEELAHARAVLAAAAGGVGLVDGQMVDGAHIAMARGVLARAGEAL